MTFKLNAFKGLSYAVMKFSVKIVESVQKVAISELGKSTSCHCFHLFSSWTTVKLNQRTDYNLFFKRVKVWYWVSLYSWTLPTSATLQRNFGTEPPAAFSQLPQKTIWLELHEWYDMRSSWVKILAVWLSSVLVLVFLCFLCTMSSSIDWHTPNVNFYT